MKRNIITACLLFVILAGCASVPVVPADTKFTLENFKVNLTQKLQVEGYPVQPEFTQIMKENFIASLKAGNLLAEPGSPRVMSVSVDIDYQRIFTGEGLSIKSKSAVAPFFGYTLVVTDGGIEKKRIIESRLTLDRGFFGNLKTFGTMGFGRTPKDELKDIKKITDYLAYKLDALKK